MAVNAARVHVTKAVWPATVLKQAVLDDMNLIVLMRKMLMVMVMMMIVLELEPTAYRERWQRRWSVRWRSPLSHGATAPRTLVLLGGILATEARTTGSALGRCFEVGRGRELRSGPSMARVSGRQTGPRSSGRLGRRGSGQGLNRLEALVRLRVNSLK